MNLKLLSFRENVNKIVRQVFYIKSTEKQRLYCLLVATLNFFKKKPIKGMNERKISKKYLNICNDVFYHPDSKLQIFKTIDFIIATE